MRGVDEGNRRGSRVGFRRSPRVTYDVLDGHAVLVHPDAVEMLTLNAVGTLVWQRLDGHLDASELAEALLPSLEGVTGKELTADIAGFLAGLAEEGLVVEDPGED